MRELRFTPYNTSYEIYVSRICAEDDLPAFWYFTCDNEEHYGTGESRARAYVAAEKQLEFIYEKKHGREPSPSSLQLAMPIWRVLTLSKNGENTTAKTESLGSPRLKSSLVGHKIYNLEGLYAQEYPICRPCRKTIRRQTTYQTTQIG